jgi:hypothetical protein
MSPPCAAAGSWSLRRVRASFERATQLTRRYVEVAQAVTVSVADTAKRQARKAA